MSYQLGIDFGTTSVAAAIRRDGAPTAEVVPLGGTGATVPAVLHLARDGAVTVGDSAARLAGIDAGRVVRALTRRMDDPTPIVVGRESWTVEELSARVVRWVVDRVAEQEGGPAATVALAHPAPWPAPTLERLAAALAGQDVPVTFVSEPQAVAVAYTAQSVLAGAEPVDTVAVYDLGGGRFDAAVLQRAVGGPVAFDLRGRPEGLTDVGGLDADDLVWDHVRPGLPDGVVLDAKVRRACVRAKEALSTKTEVVVRVRRGELAGEVRLRRGTFEVLIAPHVERTVAVLQRVVASAGLTAADLDAVLVVGGASRIPLVARTVSAQLGRSVTVLETPELLVARGAALALPATDEPVPASEVAGARDDAAVTVRRSGRSAGIPAAPAAAVSPEPASDHDVDAPTLAFPVPLRPEPPTAPYGTPVLLPAAAPASSAPATDPEATDEGDADGARDRPAEEPVRAPHPPVRIPAVLESGARPGHRSRSVARLLIGAGAVVVAVLVVVALFRPDGPLDPPLDPTATAATRAPGAPAPPVPTSAASAPAVGGVRGDDAAEDLRTDAAGRLRAEDAAAAVTLPGAIRSRGSDDGPAGDSARSGVDTTPPPVPTLRTTRVAAAPRDGVDRDGADQDGSPVGAAPRTPPTPAAPLA